MKLNAAFCLLPLAVAGCASVVDGSTQSLSVSTPGTDKAQCKLVNDKGTWYVPETPGTVAVHRAYDDMVVTCQKEGFKAASTSVKSSTKGMAAGNIIFGGIIGGGVDMATGAAYDYPSEIMVPMERLQTAGLTK